MRLQSPLMVGRDAELAALQARFDRARAGPGTPGAVVVRGEAGIGKTRLIHEFLRGPVNQAGGLGVVGACLDLGAGGVPYAAFLELLRHLRRSLGHERWVVVATPYAEALAPLLDGGGGGPDHVPVPNSTAPEDIRRARLFGGVLDLLDTVGRSRPLVLVLEDLHWADLATLELTAFLIRNLRDSPVLTVVTVRSDEVAHDDRLATLLAAVEREVDNVELALERLSPDDTQRQLQAIVGSAASAEEVSDLHRRSGGNPFLVEELIALAATGDPTDIPMIARDILLARYSALSADGQALVAAAAIGGASVTIEHLREVLDSPVDSPAFAAALGDAVRHGVLMRPTDDDVVQFRHALARDAALADMLAGERRRWHARWATILAPLADATPSLSGEIAGHLDDAGQPDVARTWWLRAGASASDQLAFDAAATAYQLAIDRYRRHPSSGHIESVPSEALELAARAMRFAGRNVDAVRLAERMVAAAPTSDPDTRALALERLGTFRIDVGDDEGAVAATAEAVESLRGGPPELFARVSLSHAICLVHLVRFDDVLEIIEPALQVARDRGLTAIEATGLCQRGLVRALRGELDGAAADFDASWRLALASGDTEAILLIALDRPLLDEARGDFAGAAKKAMEGIATIERIGAIDSFDALGLLTNAAYLLWLLGRWEDAESQLSRVERQETLGGMRDDAILLRARVRAHRGDFDRARMDLAAPRPDLGAQMNASQSVVASEIALLAGDPWGAIRAAADAMERAAPIGNYTGLLQRAEAAVQGAAAASAIVERRPGASERRQIDGIVARLVDGFHGAVEAMPAGWAPPESQAWRRDLDAWLHRLGGRADHDAWAASVESWTRLGVPYRAAWSAFRQTEGLLEARGDRGGIGDLLRASWATASALGAQPLQREIEALARRARIDTAGIASVRLDPHPGPVARYDLTSRELDVLRLIVAGRSNREIGEALFISPKTAGVHVGNILGKLGVSGRVGAATLAVREGLIEK